jgi:hypothetical protein
MIFLWISNLHWLEANLAICLEHLPNLKEKKTLHFAQYQERHSLHLS